MKVKYILSAMMVAAAMPVAAQETYENANLVTEDLNGTARYVGIGRAMEALGSNLSTIDTNPAGVGLFRHSQANITGSLLMKGDVPSGSFDNKARTSLDQIGFVYSMKTKHNSYLNLAFNYHKTRNFNSLLSASGDLGGQASQNALSFIKALGGDNDAGETTFNIEDNEHWGLMGTSYYTSQLDNLYYNNFIVDDKGVPGYNFANGYLLNREQRGYVGSYDFNISGSINNRVFLGITFGIKDVHYKSYSEYSEQLVNIDNSVIGDVTVMDMRAISGTGFDIKAGVIIRPIEDSPFRIGAYVHTPTWYDLTTENITAIDNGTDIKGYNKGWFTGEAYDFKLYTPWKFGLSLGHTVGNYLALGATYEYSDYQDLETRVNDGGVYDYYYDDWYDKSTPDRPMNRHTKETLKGVSTVKLGAEYKPIPTLAMRIGYNYVSPMYDKNGFKDGSIDSYGSNYATMTDYTNWKGTNRLTLGLGYTVDKVSIDLAYQYTTQKGDFYPFMNSWADYHYIDDAGIVQTEQIDNYATKTEVKDSRHQLLLTLGYHF